MCKAGIQLKDARTRWCDWVLVQEYNRFAWHGMALGLDDCLKNGNVPDWMVKERTVLLQKDSAKGTVASNYRAIACLPIMWKLLTRIFTEETYDHLKDNNLLPDEQKGYRKRS